MKPMHVKIRRAAIAAVAACSMLLPVGVTSATETPGLTVNQGAGYTATKISHPNADLGENDGIVNVDANGTSTVADGDADRGQNYSWASVGYGDWMYVGTCYSAMGSTLKLMANTMGTTYKKLKAALDVAFNGEMFLDNGENHSLLLKINTKTGKVKIVVDPIQKATGADLNVNGYRAAIEFHDKLYFAAAAQGSPYLLEVDPTTDKTQIVYQATGVASGISVGIRGLAVLNGQLIASMIGTEGAYIVSSSNPSAGADSFTTIATQQDLLDYPAYHYTDNIFGGAIWDMVAFNGKLYITVVTGKGSNKQSFALFRGEQNADESWTYTPLVGDPKDGAHYEYGFGADRSGAANLVVYKDHLYIGGYNDPMVALPDALEFNFESLYDDLSSPVNLWRMDADENFELVAGESNNKYFGEPVGTIDGETMRAGLGSDSDMSRHLNQYVWRMQAYDGKMYAGTFDISDLAYPVTQFANGDVLKRTPEQWKKQIEYIKEFLKLLKADGNGSSTTAESSSLEATKPEDGNVDGDADATAGDDAEDGAAAQSQDNAADEQRMADNIASEGKTSEVIANLTEMRKLLDNMRNDLESKQTDVDIDEASAQSDDYTLDDRFQFQRWLNKLLALYNSNKQYLPESITAELDKWLTQDNVDNFTYFVGVCNYLHYATSDKRGCDLVVTSDGLNFQTITRNGFGDNNNHGLRVFAVTNSGLSIGTANPYHGTQIWKLDDGKGDAVNAELADGDAYTYDKYDTQAKAANQQGLSVGITFNGNTVEDVQYDYASLKAGEDYVVNEDGSGITLTSAFLNAKETGSTGSVVVFFNRGARARFTVEIKDGTPGASQPAKPSESTTKPADQAKPSDQTKPADRTESAESTAKPSESAKTTESAKTAGQTTQSAAKSAANVANTIASTGSNVWGMVLAVAVLALAGGVMLVLRRRG
ncbi:X2-like carbohydrate binding domain-containing protein [Bifidobacterium moukalabense]|uniref:X2-like carbohydrate binding domain-containing protein n=1 Tax=Bifidobacterium moukalabense TaxID=1333651 RepID=UPI001FCE5D7D|nr:X2-like carbohydrate binding domain-containing protein [Bifidobacterium moukalabense]